MKYQDLFPFLLVVVAACAGHTPRTGADAPIQMEAMRVAAVPDPLVGLDGYDAQQLFELGRDAFGQADYRRASALYEKLLAEFPESTLRLLARYNAGLSYEHQGDWQKAREHFEAIAGLEAGPEDLRADAHFHLGRAYAQLELWPKTTQTFQDLRRGFGDALAPLDEIEARAGEAVGLFMQESYEPAEREFFELIRFYEEHEEKDALPAEYFVGQARFYLAEIQARTFEQSPLVAPEEAEHESWVKSMAEQLEAKCDHLLRAQARFIRVFRVGHRGWATAAGFRIGALYESLFDELLQVPTPPGLSSGASQLYRDELRARVAVLLKKAIRVYEANQEMAERVGEKNVWVERTETALERMKKLYLAATQERS